LMAATMTSRTRYPVRRQGQLGIADDVDQHLPRCLATLGI
jgi:hypothetical protein